MDSARARAELELRFPDTTSDSIRFIPMRHFRQNKRKHTTPTAEYTEGTILPSCTVRGVLYVLVGR